MFLYRYSVIKKISAQACCVIVSNIYTIILAVPVSIVPLNASVIFIETSPPNKI